MKVKVEIFEDAQSVKDVEDKIVKITVFFSAEFKDFQHIITDRDSVILEGAECVGSQGEIKQRIKDKIKIYIEKYKEEKMQKKEKTPDYSTTYQEDI